MPLSFFCPLYCSHNRFTVHRLSSACFSVFSASLISFLEGLFPSIRSVLDEYEDADEEYAQVFFRVLELTQVSEWRNAHPCNSTVLRAVGDVWDKIMLGEIERDEIQAELDAIVPVAQEALDECRERLGG